MDRTTLVSEQRDAGQCLIDKLVRIGFDVQAAAWIKTSDDGQWCLYIASQVVDSNGFFSAYREVQTTIRKMPNLAIGPFDVKLVSASDPLVAHVQRLYAKFPAPLQTQFGGSQLGKMNIEEALIYPPVSAPTAKPQKRPRSTIHSTKSVVKSKQ